MGNIGADTVKNSSCLIHLLLAMLPLTALLMIICPECHDRMLAWVFGDLVEVSRRTRIVLWGTALLPSVVVYGYQVLRLWLNLEN